MNPSGVTITPDPNPLLARRFRRLRRRGAEGMKEWKLLRRPHYVFRAHSNDRGRDTIHDIGKVNPSGGLPDHRPN